jgi:hypothetical protein
MLLAETDDSGGEKPTSTGLDWTTVGGAARLRAG